LAPKKKHYKKLIAYVRKVEDSSNVTDVLINKLMEIGIAHEYPVTLGQTVRDMIAIDDAPIHPNSFTSLIMFLERCKGFEADARKFLHLTSLSSHL
jgi:hypothetical protein